MRKFSIFKIDHLYFSCKEGRDSEMNLESQYKNIRLLTDASDGHDIDCKIDGIGQMKLKSEFVKKA